VLEHLPLPEFDSFCRELYRVTRPGGASSHNIDFRDHLSSSLNSLRFTERVWESSWFAKSGFYTNRLRLSHVLKAFTAFTEAGFVVANKEQIKWDRLPVPRRSLDRQFRDLSDDDLLTHEVNLVLRKPG
jgi:hypothetical protein